MPHYEVHHSCSLTQSQYQKIATAFTRLHCKLFSAPSAFVNVSYHYTPAESPVRHTVYIGGQPVSANYIHAHLRPRGPENAPKLHQLVIAIMGVWNELIQKGEGRLDDPMALHNVFLFEDVAAGAEQGFLLPLAGEDGNWVKDNMQAFEKRAREGDESFKTLLAEHKAGFGSQG